MSTQLRRFSIAFVVATTALVLASAARAGTYDVSVCDAAPGAVNNSWTSTVQLADAVTAFSACPSGGDPNRGLVARNAIASAGSSVSQGAVAQWVFRAPAGTAIVGLAASYRFYHASSTWEAALSDGTHIIRGCGLGSGACDVSSPGEFIPLGRLPVIYIDVYCGAGPCPISSTGDAAHGYVQATANLYSATVRLEDDSPPSLSNPSGALWSDGWHSGIDDYSFDSTDSAGVAQIRAVVDGSAIANTNTACDFSRAVPCPNGHLSGMVDTRTIKPDGSHTLLLQSIDPAGNVAQVSRTILVDNTAPGPPQNLTVQGGDGWRNTNAFTLTWTNPPETSEAPIDSAIARMCPAGDPNASTCQQQTVTGSNITQITGLKVPGEGDWDLRLWLHDAAGNASSANAGDAEQLRFDDAAPTSAAFAPRNPSDPTKVTVHATDSASGIAGGTIQYKKANATTWHPMAVQLVNGDLVTHVDDEDLANGTYDLQATVTDAAGNERSTSSTTSGGPATFTLPLRLATQLTVGRRTRVRHGVLLRARLHVAQSHRVRLRGRLTNGSGVAFAGTAVEVFQRAHLTGATWTPTGQLQTSKTGRFSFLARAGVSRTLRFRYAGTPIIRAADHDVVIEVDARTTFTASKHRVVNGQTIRLHGHLRGGHYPAGGKLITLQVYLRGAWHTFATTRSHAHGRWHFDYRFDGTVGTQHYMFRAVVPHEATYPFATGASRVTHVTVRGVSP